MKSLVAVLASLIGFVASADDGRIQGQTLAVKERLVAIEQINVTAQKEADESAPVDQDVAAILADAEAADD